MRWLASCLAVVLLLGFVGLAQAEEFKENAEEAKEAADAGEVIVKLDSTWKYLHPSDGTDPAEAEEDFNKKFSTADYDDAKWKEGKDGESDEAGFGYGDPVGVEWDTPEAENRKTGYLRLKFKTEKAFEKLTISMQRDDGVVVYIDGKEVGRENVGKGKEAYDLMAEKTIGGDDEKKVVKVELKGDLKPGEHVLAISLHNRPQGSSDLRIAQITLKGVPANAEE